MKSLLIVFALCGCAAEVVEESAYTLVIEGDGMRQPTNEAKMLVRDGERLFLK